MKRSRTASPQGKRPKIEDFGAAAVETWIAVGNCSITLGLVAAALKSFEFALAHNESHPKALTRLSHCLRLNDLQSNEVHGSQRAVETLTQALERYPKLLQELGIFKELAECYLMLGVVDQAQLAVQTSMQSNDKDPSLWLLNAETLIRKNDRAQAGNSLMKCLSMLPDSLLEFSPDDIEVARSAHAELAAISAADGNIELSIAELTATLSLPPPPLTRIDENFALWCALATAKERANDIEGALQACEGAESILGDSPRILMTHAYLLLVGNSPERAESALTITQKIIDIENNGNGGEPSSDGDFLPWYLMGKAYSILGCPRTAYDCYQVALRRASNSPITWLAVGRLYLELKQLPDALAAYSQALRLHIDENSHATALAWDGLSCVYEQSDEQLMDASDACSRAAACFQTIGDTESAQFFEDRAKKLMLASEKKGPVPPLRESSDVPNFLIRDYVALLPVERIALVQGNFQTQAQASAQQQQQQQHQQHQHQHQQQHQQVNPQHQNGVAAPQGHQSPANRPQSTIHNNNQKGSQSTNKSPETAYYQVPQGYGGNAGSPVPHPNSQQAWSPNAQVSSAISQPQFPQYYYQHPPPGGIHVGPLPVPNPQIVHRSPVHLPQMMPNGIQYSLPPTNGPGLPGPQGPQGLQGPQGPPPPPGYAYGQYVPVQGGMDYVSPVINWRR